MSTKSLPPQASAIAVAQPLKMREVTELLIRHYGIHEGHYDLLLEYQFGVGAFGPDPESITPGAVIGISKLGLARAAQLGPLTVDASKVNPQVAAKDTKAKVRRSRA